MSLDPNGLCVTNLEAEFQEGFGGIEDLCCRACLSRTGPVRFSWARGQKWCGNKSRGVWRRKLESRRCCGSEWRNGGWTLRKKVAKRHHSSRLWWRHYNRRDDRLRHVMDWLFHSAFEENTIEQELVFETSPPTSSTPTTSTKTLQSSYVKLLSFNMIWTQIQ